MSKELYLCIHGHFYQPPRENPWIEKIELQRSAAPFHDWNERIHHECYRPNAFARVLDDKGYIINLVNNYEGISFNFGPTLFSWLENEHPKAYHHVIHADETSRKQHGGHGNAIAQVYNHMIMPLANGRDKITQVRWGIDDFKHRFKRNPEAMWLPETACNEETLEVLVQAGMKYVILEPNQAEAIRPLDGNEWQSVAGGTIDPKQPYRFFLTNQPEKYIDIFFYDGPIAKDSGFGDLLFDAKRFMDRIEGAIDQKREGPQLIHIATDGETFGHHRAFADRALAYLISIEAIKRGYKIVNYAEYLEKFPPRFAVRLAPGEENLGTSWSCSHGVKRWKDHCGCRGEGPSEWNQNWRKPLREALDWLRDELSHIFESKGHELLKNVWEARNDYIQVVLNRSEKSFYEFFHRHAKRILSKKEVTAALKLLEMQRHAMLMYTSCGWFFTEISGIETVQIIQYAARTIQIAKEISGVSLEEKFLERLSAAKSNVAQFKDGRVIYEKLVKPAFVYFDNVICYYAIDSIFEEFEQKDNFKLYCFDLHVPHQRKESYGNLILNFGRIKITSRVTLKEYDAIFIVLKFGVYDFRCSIKPFSSVSDLEQIEKRLFDSFHKAHIVELMRIIDDLFGEKYYSIRDLPLEWRIKVISILTKESIQSINEAYDRLYEDNRTMNEIYRSINLPIPEEVRYAAQHTLRRRVVNGIYDLIKKHFDTKKAPRVARLIDLAKELNVELNQEEMQVVLTQKLSERTKELADNVREELLAECISIQKIAKKANIQLDERDAQDHLFLLLKKWHQNPELMAKISTETVNGILKLANSIWINPKELKKDLQKLSS